MRDIGKNIRYYREKKGYSQEQLAQLLFVTRQTVSNYETGRSRPDVETLVKLAGLLNIEVTDLIYGPRQISVSCRSLWLRLGAAIILFGIYLWLTPFSINYAAYHYSKIPEWYRMLLLLPAMFFSLGQLSMDGLRRLWKPRPIAYAKTVRWACIVWLAFYGAAVLISFLTVYFEIPGMERISFCAHTVLGMHTDTTFLHESNMLLFFLSGAGLVLAEKTSFSALEE